MGFDCRLFTFTTQYPRLLFPGSSQLTDEPAPQDLSISRELSSINPWSWWRTGRRIKRLKPDLLIIRYWIPAMAPAFGTVARIARRAGVRTIALLDNVIPHEKRPMDTVLTRYFIDSMEGFIYMSEQVYRDLRQFTADKPALFSPHPMFTQYGEAMPREEACARLGLDPTLHYTLFFGYIRDYKGLDLLYEAWARLKKAGWLNHRHRLLVAGEYYGGRERYDFVRSVYSRRGGPMVLFGGRSGLSALSLGNPEWGHSSRLLVRCPDGGNRCGRLAGDRSGR